MSAWADTVRTEWAGLTGERLCLAAFWPMLSAKETAAARLGAAAPRQRSAEGRGGALPADDVKAY